MNSIDGNVLSGFTGGHGDLVGTPTIFDPTQAINNWWGAASGPSGDQLGAGDEILFAGTGTPPPFEIHRLWLLSDPIPSGQTAAVTMILENQGAVETFDETLVVTPEAADVGEWGLFSAPRVSETPTAKADLGVNVISMLGHRPDIDPSLPFVSSGIPAFDDDAGKPVSAFFVRVTNPGDPDGPVGKAGLGFNFLNPSSPGQTSKNFVTGLNLGSTNNPGLALAQNELSGIQTTLVTLHAPDVFNERKEVAFHNPYSPANADINANPITALGLTEDLGTFDGYWLTLAGPQTHQKQTIQDPYVSPPEIP